MAKLFKYNSFSKLKKSSLASSNSKQQKYFTEYVALIDLLRDTKISKIKIQDSNGSKRKFISGM